MANIKDISAKCGISIATVSKALNGYKDVSEKTKKKVLEAAKELGYFPNAQARSLKTNRSYHLGVLFIDDHHNGLTHCHFSQVLDSFKKEAEQCGYHITFITQKLGNRNLSYLQSCRHVGVEGICIACIDFEDPEVHELAESGLPMVTIDYVFENTPAVLSDNRNDIAKIVRYVSEQGHQKIAFVHGGRSRVTNERITGFIETMNHLGLEINPDMMIECPYNDTEAAKAATLKLLNRKDKPTCILLPDDIASFGAIEAIRSSGLKYPHDISIIGYDGIDFSQQMTPKLTTLKQDAESLGREAARALIYNIENPNQTHNLPITISGCLLEGESVLKIEI